jgi:iron complex transport system permease protein
MTAAPTAPVAPPRARPATRLVAGLLALGLLLVALTFASVALGARDIGLRDVADAFLHFNGTATDDTVAVEVRVPRTLLGLLVGAALGLSGAILQGLTRNPLADPGIMGINAGATLGVVAAITLLGLSGIGLLIWFGFAGAVVATVLVYAVGSLGRDGATPVKMALAGACVTAGLLAISTGLLLSDIDAINQLRFWQVGSLAGRYAPIVEGIAPFLAVGILGALLCGRPLNALALGEDAARGLGLSIGRARVGLLAVVAVLCGAACAACGPIVFVGLVVPHVARFICGPDYRWILPYALVLGPLMLLGSDVLGRLLDGSGELQVGVVLGMIGAPFFILLVRFSTLAEL